MSMWGLLLDLQPKPRSKAGLIYSSWVQESPRRPRLVLGSRQGEGKGKSPGKVEVEE